jgi:hypothetical protein
MENRNYYTIILSLIGAAKLILNSFGIDIINDQMSNELANAIATILTIGGVILQHIKGKPNFKAWFAKIFKKNTPVEKPTQPTQVSTNNTTQK